MDVLSREKYLIHMMNNGFAKAAVSFSRLTNRVVNIGNSQAMVVNHDGYFSHISHEEGDLYILITQVIGDISGKSFLIFNRDERAEIYNALNTSTKNESLNEAFLVEIDNIISASVIMEISNSLELELYGDVPELHKVHSRDLQDFMNAEISRNNDASMIFCNTTFAFDNHEQIHPQFIWKLNTKIFEKIGDQQEIV